MERYYFLLRNNDNITRQCDKHYVFKDKNIYYIYIGLAINQNQSEIQHFLTVLRTLHKI